MRIKQIEPGFGESERKNSDRFLQGLFSENA